MEMSLQQRREKKMWEEPVGKKVSELKAPSVV